MRVPNYGNAGALDRLTGMNCSGGVASVGYNSNARRRLLCSSVTAKQARSGK